MTYQDLRPPKISAFRRPNRSGLGSAAEEVLRPLRRADSRRNAVVSTDGFRRVHELARRCRAGDIAAIAHRRWQSRRDLSRPQASPTEYAVFTEMHWLTDTFAITRELSEQGGLPPRPVRGRRGGVAR
jgi:hypothetical protein